MEAKQARLTRKNLKFGYPTRISARIENLGQGSSIEVKGLMIKDRGKKMVDHKLSIQNQ